MLIAKHRSLLHILKTMKYLNNILLLSLAVIALLFLYYYYSIPLEVKALGFPLSKKSEKKMSNLFDYTQIGGGSFSLCPEIRHFSFPNLGSEILLLSRSSRPDFSFVETKLELGLMGSDQSVVAIPDQTFYLSYDQGYLNFSKEATPLSITPKINNEGEAFLEMGVELILEGGERLLNERREYKIYELLKPKEVEEIVDKTLAWAAGKLKKGKWWAPDRLFEQYGGEEYFQYKGLERIKFEDTVLFIKEGDLLIWKEGRWQKGDETKEYPLAEVMEITPYKMEWRLWDKTGLESAHTFFSREKAPNLSLKIEDVFTHLKQRTMTRVSCRLNNRATILKAGDWIVRTKNGWYPIKNYPEVVALLNFETDGELFIFDGIEKTEGKQFFAGTLFDLMRTQVQHVKLPITQHSSPTKKKLSTKIYPATLTKEVAQEPVKKSKQELSNEN